MHLFPLLIFYNTGKSTQRPVSLVNKLVRYGFKNWSSHRSGSHSGLQITHPACQIHTPLRLLAWQKVLPHCPIVGMDLRLLLSETCVRCGEFFDQQWFHWQRHHNGFNVSIMVKELVPITSSCAAWGPRFAKASSVTTLV